MRMRGIFDRERVKAVPLLDFAELFFRGIFEPDPHELIIVRARVGLIQADFLEPAAIVVEKRSLDGHTRAIALARAAR
ncbi:hypothetical protein GCM10023325_05690 [Sphingomonas lutea]